jgi:hypothetical protein
MTVQDAISQAETAFQQHRAPRSENDPRWLAVAQVAHFTESEPGAVWSFIRKWGRSKDSDLRMAVATCLLEHLLEHHFDRFIAFVEDAALSDARFADTVCGCWKFGQAKEPSRAARLDRVQAMSRQKAKRLPRSQRFTVDVRALGRDVAAALPPKVTASGKRAKQGTTKRGKVRKRTA